MYPKDRLEFNTNFICSLVLLYLQKSIAKSHLQKKKEIFLKIKKKKKKNMHNFANGAITLAKATVAISGSRLKLLSLNEEFLFFYDLITKESAIEARITALWD